MANIKYEDLVTITIETPKMSFPVTDWDFSDPYSKTPKGSDVKPLECSRKKAEGALKIAGKTFPEYIAYRLMKDGIGFKVAKSVWDAATDRKNYIECTIPKTPKEFMVYCHELGHVKSRQYDQNYGMFFSTCKNTLKNEANAWIWGIRYFKRLGFEITEEILSDIRYAFATYTQNADRSAAQESLQYLKAKTGVDFEMPRAERRRATKGYSHFHWQTNTKLDTIPWTKYIDPKKEEKPIKGKPKAWKPWHDLKAKQLKKAWRHQK